MIKKQIILIIVLSVFLISCAGTKDALQGKKRSETSDEFLVKKKNPLVMPPDYSELPKPKDQTNDENIEEENVLSKIGKSKSSKNSKTKNDNEGSLEQSILKQINE
tara:strand:+ start:789 stop:1106 length:318 start_codon:yes stop_codon:yes gene_type:complete